MLRSILPSSLLGLLAVTIIVGGAERPQKDDTRPKPSARADSLDLLLLGGARPVRLELKVERDGKSIPAIWDDSFARLHQFHDRNEDGSLDRTEAALLPSAFVLRQLLWGRFALSGSPALPFDQLDLDGDERVSPAELSDFYRRHGLGGVLVGVGQPPASRQLTDAILKHLDSNRNGEVSEEEWKAAPTVLGKRDTNDDELIGPGELVAGTAYPGAMGTILLTAPSAGAVPDPLADRMPLLVLPLRTADTTWGLTAVRRANKAACEADAEKMLAVRKDVPAVSWVVRLGTEKVSLAPTGGLAPSDALLSHSWGRNQLILRADEGKRTSPFIVEKKRLVALFAECDVNHDRLLDVKETTAPVAGILRPLLPIADRDGDSKLSEKELTAWLALQEQLVRGQVLLTLLDHGPELFEFLDADHDCGLSIRELRSAWERLKTAECVVKGQFVRAQLPRHLIAAVSHGHPHTALGKAVRGGPEWFRAMDRNGDGDVSRREFLGTNEAFAKWDTDNDGLISPQEAERK